MIPCLLLQFLRVLKRRLTRQEALDKHIGRMHFDLVIANI